MRIFLFLILSLFIWGCSTLEVSKEVIKVSNTITNKVKESVPKEDSVIEEIIQEKAIEEEIEIIEEKQEIEKNIIENQKKLADINFIGETEKKIFDLLGEAQLSRVDGTVYTLRYDTENCRLFLFFNQKTNIKRVEYFELRNNKAELLNSKEVLEECNAEFVLLN